TPADLSASGLAANVVIPPGSVFNTETGQIGAVRPANSDASAREVKSGIAFHPVMIPGSNPPMKMGIWSFNGVRLDGGAPDQVTGRYAMALVSAGDLVINAQLDLTCASNVAVSGMPFAAGPGGNNGADSSAPKAMGEGGGTSGTGTTSGGG